MPFVFLMSDKSRLVVLLSGYIISMTWGSSSTSFMSRLSLRLITLEALGWNPDTGIF